MADAVAHIDGDFFHNQCAVVTGVAALAVNDRVTSLGHGDHHRQVFAAANGVHKQNDVVAARLFGLEMVGFKGAKIQWAAVGFLKRAFVLIEN